MLKKQFIKKFTITTAILFSFFLMCIIPNKKYNSEVKQKLEYVNKELKTETIYLLDHNNYLAKTKVVINSKDIDLKAKELLNILIKEKEENKIPSGFRTIIPSNTEVLSLEYKDHIIKVNFNENLLDVKKEYEEKVIESIVYTLTSMEQIDKVIIYIDGNIVSKLPKSKKILPSILDKNYGINKEYDIKTYKDVKKVTMYYLNNYNNSNYYVPVTKYINEDKDKFDIIIEQLSNSNNNLISYLNNNVTLLDKKIEANKAILTFNEYIFDNKEEQTVLDEVKNSIGLSIIENYDIDEVIFKYNEKQICKIDKKVLNK